MIPLAASRRKILRKAIASVLETLEGRTYMTAITAGFTNGSGTSSVDQYAGTTGSGWDTSWQLRSTSATWTSDGVSHVSPQRQLFHRDASR